MQIFKPKLNQTTGASKKSADQVSETLGLAHPDEDVPDIDAYLSRNGAVGVVHRTTTTTSTAKPKNGTATAKKDNSECLSV